jgi:thiol:disulfide interchange protein DsbD
MPFHFLLSLEKLFSQSPIFGLGVSFIAGIIASLSPCIYPLIPVTLGIIGTTQVSSKIKSFYASFIFVLGISFIYTILGIVASIFGIFLDVFFINPFTYIILSGVFLFLGLSLFDVIRLNFPIFSFNFPSKRKSILSIFVLGMISGLGIIPCNFPVLGAILTLISLKKDILYAGISLFLFSLGQGFLLIILGTFTFLIRKLPKKGYWLIIIKRSLGIILLGVSLFFFLRFISLK